MDMFAVRGDPWDQTRLQPPKPRFGYKTIQRQGQDDIVVDQTAKYLERRREYDELTPDDGDPDMDCWTKAGFKSPTRQRKKASPTGNGFVVTPKREGIKVLNLFLKYKQEKAARLRVVGKLARKEFV